MRKFSKTLHVSNKTQTAIYFVTKAFYLSKLKNKTIFIINQLLTPREMTREDEYKCFCNI